MARHTNEPLNAPGVVLSRRSAPLTQRLGEAPSGNGLGLGQVGDRARQLGQVMEGAARELEPLSRRALALTLATLACADSSQYRSHAATFRLWAGLVPVQAIR